MDEYNIALETIKNKYIKILVVNLTTRKFSTITIPEEEKAYDFETIDEYFEWFSKSSLLHDEDKQLFAEYTKNLQPSTTVIYRRKQNDQYIHTFLEVSKSEAYTDDYQQCIICVKDVDNTYTREAVKIEESAKRIDGMTGALNHKAFEDDISKPHKGNIGVAFMDINGLKYINDTYGHGKGDEVVKQIAKLLKTQFPAYPIYRTGGDEFVIIAYNAKIRTFIHTLTAFHKRLWNEKLIYPDYPILSIGYSADTADDLSEILLDAERQMYEDKEIFYAKFNNLQR